MTGLGLGVATPATLFTPPTSQLALSDDERRVMNWLSSRLLDPGYQSNLNLSALYRDGMNTVESLGIAIPPELDALRVVMGWCGTGIAARGDRLRLQGFRMPDRDTVDEDLLQAWQVSNLDFESTLVHDDAMTYGRGFATLGVRENRSEPPLTTVESPLSMFASWDQRRNEVSAAYKTYFDVDPGSETFERQCAALYTRTAIVHLVAGRRGWEVVERTNHTFGAVPVIMFANQASTMNRYGFSEIAPSWRNSQDRAARGAARNEVAAEFFASLKVWLLGVEAGKLQKADGSPASAFETFVGRLSTLAADNNGVLPQVFVQQGQDPTGLIKFIDHERQQFSAASATPLDYLGAIADGANAASSDAITKGDYRLFKRASRLIIQFGNGWEDWGRLALRMWKGELPEGAEQLESDWERPTIPTPNADVVSVTTQIKAGMIAPDDDDAMARLDWSPVQRKRIKANLTRYQGKVRDQQLLGTALRGGPDGGDASGSQEKAQQPLDGEQPDALNALALSRDGVPAAR